MGERVMAQVQGWEGPRAPMICHLLLLWLQLSGLRPFLRASTLLPSGMLPLRLNMVFALYLAVLAPLEANPCLFFHFTFLLLLYPNLHSGDTTVHGLPLSCSSCLFPAPLCVLLVPTFTNVKGLSWMFSCCLEETTFSLEI